MKAIPIKFNDNDLADLKELVDLLGLTNTYGADPKAIKLAIRLAIDRIKKEQALINKVIPSLKPSEKLLYLTSITEQAKQQINLDLKHKITQKPN